MVFEEYLELADRTNRERMVSLENVESQLLHASLGLTTELVELKSAYDRFDVVNVKEELGDMFWYLALIYNYCSARMPERIDINIQVIIEDGNVLGVSYCLEALGEEIAQFVDVMKRHIFYGTSLDYDYIEELAESIFYYMEVLAIRVGGLDDVLTTNIEKLKVRYPEGFSEDDAVNRDLENERKVLE